jgi:hypothetical protein
VEVVGRISSDDDDRINPRCRNIVGFTVVIRLQVSVAVDILLRSCIGIVAEELRSSSSSHRRDTPYSAHQLLSGNCRPQWLWFQQIDPQQTQELLADMLDSRIGLMQILVDR